MNKSLTFLIGLLMIAAGGCQVSFEPKTMVMLTPSPSTTITSTRTWTATASHTPVPTETSTPTQMPTKTATNTPTATWTPVPTLAPDTALARIRELYQDTEPCVLPCWWGITPGQTPWAQARHILSELSPEYGPYYRDNVTRYKYSFEVPENFEALNLGFIEVSIYVSGDMVIAISTNTGWLHRDFNFSRSSLLALLGEPDEIWIRHTIPDPGILIEYELDLLYMSKGVLLNISGEAQIENNTLAICPQNFQRGAFPAAITMYSPEIADSFEQLREMMFGKYDLAETHYVRIETVTDGFGESEFYNMYKNENANECFEVSVK
jgi:hypothetical protein